MNSISPAEFERALRAQLHAPPPPPPPAIIRQAPIAAEEIVAACIIAEAGGEGHLGMAAVMNVIDHRAGGDPAKYLAVVTRAKQFSCFNDGVEPVVAKARQHPRYQNALMLVEAGKQGRLPDFVKGAKHYHTHAVQPKWSRGKQPCVSIGGHRFFNDID